MANLLLAFMTGLTTGGLSCMAVQGGLLASSLAHQIEQNLLAQAPAGRKSKRARPASATAAPAHPRLALPILVFLAARLLVYTLIGGLLGLASSVFELSPLARAGLQIAIGIFMAGSALRMLNVHPIFRYFAFEPPAFLRRHIRKTAKGGQADGLASAALLGLLTGLIPCGITQAMMAVALSTGDALQGAALLFAFTLGTSPVFFALAYFATRLGARLERHFMRVVAIGLLILGVVSIDTGLTLAGAPFSLTRNANRLSAQTAARVAEQAQSAAEIQPSAGVQPSAGEQAESPSADGLQVYNPPVVGSEDEFEAGGPAADEEGVLTIQVNNTGYEPSLLRAPAGQAFKLHLVSKNVYSCSLAFVIPSLGVQLSLKPNGEAYVDIPAQPAGTSLPFSCSMGMFTGDIVFE